MERITQHQLEHPLRLRGFQFLGFSKGLDPTQGPGFLGIFVSAWQRHDNTDTTSFPFSFLNSFSHTYMISFVSKQGHATKVFIQMAPPLKLSFLGCSRFRKLIQPLSIRHDLRLSHGGPPCGAMGPIVHWLWCGSVQTVFFQEGDGRLPIVIDSSSQGRLRLLSGTPQRAMEPLEIAKGFSPWEKAPIAQKHFVVILGGATQFHLGSEPTFARHQPSLQLGSHLGKGVFFQLVQHDATVVLKQIHGTSFSETLAL